MIALQIPNVKSFMVKLFQQSEFHFFYVTEISIKTLCDFKINGKRNKDFYTLEEQEQKAKYPYILWEELKPFIFQLIKGNKTPLSFHIVFMLSEQNTTDIIQKYQAEASKSDEVNFYLNIRFEYGKLTLVSGIARKDFTLDKTIDRIWEEEIKSFLKHCEIPFEENL